MAIEQRTDEGVDERLAVASFAPSNEPVLLTARPMGATLLLLSGTPLEEPVVFGGPFCMTTEADLTDAQQRFRRGDMGRLAASF